MNKTLVKIERFLKKHYVMTLATVAKEGVSSCSVFYVFDANRALFVFASSEDTEHMQNIFQNPQVALNLFLETDVVGKIEGLQVRGSVEAADEASVRLYFQKFPYARALLPKLWIVKAEFMKLTDNRLGFGKKLSWTRSLA